MRACFVDLGEASASELQRLLRDDGIVLFRHGSVELLHRLLSGWTEPADHPHQQAAGLTLIAPRVDATSDGADRGFTNADLAVHTDRSLVSRPPALLATLVVEAAQAGGEASLLDGAFVIETLVNEFGPARVADLRLVTDQGEGVPIFTFNNGHCAIRLRNDTVARPGNGDRALLKRLNDLLHSALSVRLTVGDGYILHNHRVLHGRREFNGSRAVARILADATSSSAVSWLNQGFIYATAA